MEKILIEGTMLSAIGSAMFGLLPYIVGLPAAMFYCLKWYRLYKNKEAI